MLCETRQFLVGAVPTQSGSEHIWLPTASGPMPVAAVINGQHHAVHADHLNTPRRLADRSGQVRWQWSYSGFGEAAAQALAAPGQAPVRYSLRYPGQVDDGNGLFYNWHRFYDPVAGRYTQADPIGLEGGVESVYLCGGNPISYADPTGLCPWCAAGFAIGVWSNIGAQLAQNGGNWGQLNAGQVILSGGAGALSGGLGTITAGLRIASNIAANAAGSAAIGAVQQVASNGLRGQCASNGVGAAALRAGLFGGVGAGAGAAYGAWRSAANANSFLNTSNAVRGPFFPSLSTNWAPGGTVGGNLISNILSNGNQ